jgi:hypothetical protein
MVDQLFEKHAPYIYFFRMVFSTTDNITTFYSNVKKINIFVNFTDIPDIFNEIRKPVKFYFNLADNYQLNFKSARICLKITPRVCL